MIALGTGKDEAEARPSSRAHLAASTPRRHGRARANATRKDSPAMPAPITATSVSTVASSAVVMGAGVPME